MANRLQWWTIPATVVVLVRVVTLDPQPHQVEADRVEPATPIAEPALGGDPRMVVLRDASGTRTRPLPLSFDGALVVQLPAGAARQQVDFELRRYLPNAEEPGLCSHGSPRARADATIPILGLPAGRYALEVTWVEDGVEREIARDDVTVPGSVDLTK